MKLFSNANIKPIFHVRIIALSLALLTAQAFAWGDVGHLTICEIAWAHMTDQTRSFVNDLIGSKSFPLQCIWPDQVKKTTAWSKTASYHYVNTDDGKIWASSMSLNEDGDMLQMLHSIRKGLMERSNKSSQQKLCYLRFLGHLAGDSHQPLHLGRNADRGGNSMLIENWNNQPTYNVASLMSDFPDPLPESKWNDNYVQLESHLKLVVDVKKNNLHTLWDDVIIDEDILRLGFKSESSSVDLEKTAQNYAAFLLAEIKKQKQTSAYETLMHDDLLRWAESTIVLREEAYNLSKINDQETYFNSRLGMIRQSLAMAGFHLAGLLNTVFSTRSAHGVRADLEKFQQLRYAEMDMRIAAGRGTGTPFINECDTN